MHNQSHNQPAMINHSVEALGLLAHRIYNRQPLYRRERTPVLPNIPLKNHQVIDLLLLIRNGTLATHSQSHPLLVLEQLTIILSVLVQFDSQEACLARFDRGAFKRQCGSLGGTYSSVLALGVQGIYPERNTQKDPYSQSAILAYDRQLVDGLVVGNKNWEKTRAVLRSFYERDAKPDQKRYIQILLCYKAQLQKIDSFQTPWYQLWLFFYSSSQDMLIRRQSLNVQLTRRTLDYIKNLLSVPIQPREKIVLTLIQWVVQELLLQESTPEVLVDISQMILQEDLAQLNLIERAILMILLRDCLQSSLQTEKVSRTIRSVLDRTSGIKTGISNLQGIADRSTIISYLLPKNQLFSYLSTTQIPFCNYGLLPEQNEILADRYLLLTQTIDESTLLHLIQIASPTMKRRLLLEPEKWAPRQWFPNFLRLCSGVQHDLLDSFGSFLKQPNTQQVKKGLLIFSEQWTRYLKFQQQAVLENKVVQFRELIADAVDLKGNLREKIRLPRDLALLLEQFNFRDSQIIESLVPMRAHGQLDFIYEPSFIASVVSLVEKSPSKWGQYCERSIELLLEDDKFMREMLQIEPEQITSNKVKK